MNISFQWLTQGNVGMPALDFPLVQRWIGEVAVRHGFAARELTYIFCDDSTIIDVNRRFLSHDYYTDIITFDYTRGKLLRGDMYISLDTVLTNADLVGQAYDRELLRVVIHGILHLCGINDKGPGEREIMEAHENEALALYDELALTDL
ncbi:MAG: rRNA maturation RNase YbeY [Muribaculaceae bacterium]|nr:rRNA maturation RNase YbeY [Muribaculaceae bacterium]